jgi:hypothetical protein
MSKDSTRFDCCRQHEKAAEEFMEKIAMGPGSWEILPDEVKTIFINNALTWYDEMNDPQSLEIDVNTLSDLRDLH